MFIQTLKDARLRLYEMQGPGPQHVRDMRMTVTDNDASRCPEPSVVVAAFDDTGSYGFPKKLKCREIATGGKTGTCATVVGRDGGPG